VGGGAVATAWAAARYGEAVGSIAATLIMTVVFLVLSEVVPKIYFRNRADEAFPRFLWFVRFSSFVFYPVVVTAAAALRRFSGATGRSAFVTRDELRQLVRESASRLGLGERRMLESVLDFGQTRVREVMIPLPDVVSLPASATVEQLTELLRERGYTRIPVYGDRVDRVTGVVNVFDVLHDPEPKPSLEDYRRPIHIVPDTQPIPRAMVDLQQKRENMALVVDERGTNSGIVTLEDIVEEILGELADEHEELHRPIRPVKDGYVLDASVDVDDLNQELGLDLPTEGFETVAGLVLTHLGRMPRVGDRVRVGALDFEVQSVHQYGIRRLKMRVLRPPSEGTGDDGT
jgi:CBS domain containing-hemolysin-like protein